jgi:hypothetical protein
MVDRITLTEDDWIDVKHELTTGEQRRMFAAMRTAGDFDPSRVSVARALAYIVAWSLVDQSGRPAPLTGDALDDLETETFRELRDAIDLHETTVEADRDAEKKTRSSGATPSDRTLQSVA